MRALSLMFVLGIPLVAGASFDLMLIPSSSGNAIQRYDPVNNVGLGTFSSNVGSQLSVAATAGSSEALVTGGLGTQVINLSTGERLRSGTSPSGFCVLNTAGTQWLEIGALGTKRSGTMDPLSVTSSIGTFLTAASSVVLSNPTTAIALGRNAAGDIVVTSGLAFSNGSFSAAQLLVSAADVATGSQPGQMAMITVNGNKRLAFVYRSVAAGTYRLATFSINNDGTLPGGLLTLNTINLSAIYSTASSATTVAVLAGHDGGFIVGADASGVGTRVIEIGGSLGITLGQDNLVSSVTAPLGRRWHMANVVAPESGTFAVLGLGLFPVLKRRRKR